MVARIDYWKKHAVKCIENGWPLVVLGTGPAGKKPIEKNWQQKTITTGYAARLAASGTRRGIGIRCGNIVGIDDDYELGGPVTREFLAAVEELKDRYFPKAPRRIGRPTRAPLRVLRLPAGEVYRSSNIDKMQILGRGKQFVAYNVHPDTEKPYRWIDDRGPAVLKLKSLPVTSVSTLEKFKRSMYALEETFGLAPDRARSVLVKMRAGEDIEPGELVEAESIVTKACEYIANRPEWGWEEWNNNIMMPLRNASDGAEWGRVLAHKLSAQREDVYDYDETEERWQHLLAHPAKWLGWPRLNWLARRGGMPFIGPTNWDDMIFVRSDECFYNIRNHMVLTQGVFNDENVAFRQTKPARTPLQLFIEGRGATQVVDQLTWDPRRNEGLTEKRVNGEGSVKLWNTWKRPDWFGEPGNIKAWLWFMKNVYGPDWELVRKRMAFDVQYPEERPQWHVMVTGPQGIGKSTCLLPLMKWGDKFDMTARIKNDILKSTYNSYLSGKKLMFVDEPGGIDAKVWNEIKELTAGGEYIMIHAKYMQERYEAIAASWWFGGNRQDAISVQRTERRLYIVHSMAKPVMEMTHEERQPYVRRYAEVDRNWPAVVWHLKNEVHVDKVFGSTLPGDGPNKAQRAVSDMTAPLFERIIPFVRDVVKDMPVFTLSYVLEQLSADGDVELRGLDHHVLTKAFYHLNGQICHKGGKVRLGYGRGSKVGRIWTLDPDLANADPSRLTELWVLFGPGDE